MTPPADNRTAAERIRAARRAQQLQRFELEGYPVEFVRMLNRYPGMSLDDALEGYGRPARGMA